MRIDSERCAVTLRLGQSQKDVWRLAAVREFFSPPRFSELEAIARNVEGVRLIAVSESPGNPYVPADILKLERIDDIITWQVGPEALVFPADLVLSIGVQDFSHLGNPFAGLTIVFDGASGEYAYMMLTGDRSSTPWLEDVASRIARLIGARVVDLGPRT